MKKIDKIIKVNTDKCTGCRSCEAACSAFHAIPKYSVVNPARARIHVFRNELKNEYVPVYASDYTPAQCNGRQFHTIDGKEYSLCTFCGASCPSRDIFKEPDSGLPLKCDMCEGDPDVTVPMCVQACEPGCLTYEEVEVEVAEEEEKPDQVRIGLQSLVQKFGAKAVHETLDQVTRSK